MKLCEDKPDLLFLLFKQIWVANDVIQVGHAELAQVFVLYIVDVALKSRRSID